MNNRYASLAAKILALGCSLHDLEVENRRKVQAGMFLAKLLRMKENGGEIEISEQPGHFFKWFDGPSSPSLSKAWTETRDHVSMFGLQSIDPPYRQKYCLRVFRPLHVGPDKELARNGLWARGLSSVAYLKSGDWDDDDVREALRDSLGPSVEELYEEIRITLHNLNLPA